MMISTNAGLAHELYLVFVNCLTLIGYHNFTKNKWENSSLIQHDFIYFVYNQKSVFVKFAYVNVDHMCCNKAQAEKHHTFAIYMHNIY